MSAVQSRREVLTRDLVRGLLGVATIIIGARVTLPATDPPVTLQSLAVFGCGFLLPWRPAVLAPSLYVILAAFGVPVLVKGGGLSVVFGPTFGFLAGFLVVAGFLAVTWPRYRGRPWPSRLLAAHVLAALATMILLALGVGYASWVKKVALLELVAAWIPPLLPGAAIKGILAATLATAVSSRGPVR